jgi:lipopolysaccharide/colanic/teichoic acid biosynthesis glycosyltransferase
MTPTRRERPYDVVKRTIDLVGAVLVLVITLPVQLAIGCIVLLKLGRPVLFVQERPGRDGRIFKLRKFRSMVPPDPAGGLISDADRLTAFGRAIRATSLDELPSVWNVLRGDMSFVGPRPLLVSYLPRYSPVQARRHEVRPGITGLAQVSGRNRLDWDEKLRLDVDYVERRSLRTDATILVRTVGIVVRRDGVVADGQATVAEFAPAVSDGITR